MLVMTSSEVARTVPVCEGLWCRTCWRGVGVAERQIEGRSGRVSHHDEAKLLWTDDK